MSAVMLDPDATETLERCAAVLEHVVGAGLEGALRKRMHVLGGRKEFLTPEEHAELAALVEFAEQRTIEQLEARSALDRLKPLLNTHRQAS